MNVIVALPEVTACEATGCAYNSQQRCHAPAITIGDATHPACDTFLPDSHHVSPKQRAGVGACKVAGCVHNRERVCNAASIDVVMHGHEADCATFEARSS